MCSNAITHVKMEVLPKNYSDNYTQEDIETLKKELFKATFLKRDEIELVFKDCFKMGEYHLEGDVNLKDIMQFPNVRLVGDDVLVATNYRGERKDLPPWVEDGEYLKKELERGVEIERLETDDNRVMWVYMPDLAPDNMIEIKAIGRKGFLEVIMSYVSPENKDDELRKVANRFKYFVESYVGKVRKVEYGMR